MSGRGFDAITFNLTPEDNYLRLREALIKLLTGKITFAINDVKPFKQSLQVFHVPIISGKEIFKLNGEKKRLHKAALRAGFIKMTYGKITFGAELTTPNEETIEDFERYLRRRWAEFMKNAVVKWYKHGTHGDDYDGEIDNPEDEEIFPVNTDFLRIYWGFDCPKDSDGAGGKNYHYRYQTILNPRADFTPQDINYLGAVGTGLLLHSKLELPTTGIIKPLYIKKTETKII